MAKDSAAQQVIARVSNRLHQMFDGCIDLSDVKGKPKDDEENFFNTRALAALSILNETNIPPHVAGASVTDGGDDDGIDAIYIDKGGKTVYLAQSKWRSNPKKGIELNEFTRFRDGILSVLAMKWTDENKNLHRFKVDLEAALGDIDTRIVMMLAHTSEQKIAKNIQAKIDSFIDEQNKFTPGFMRFQEVDLQQVVNAARSYTRPENIDVTALLENFGLFEKPYEAVYGRISAADIADWGDKYGAKLFAENLRYTLEKSEVNDAIISTAQMEAEHFWYFNNGITAICDYYAKQPIGGNQTEKGVFEVKRISVINGAQTIGSLISAKKAGAVLDNAKVQIRIISLKNTPEGFSSKVTNANNTQNDLNPVDFVAADSNQERLKKEAANIGITYTYRRGDKAVIGPSGFDVREATIATACSSGDLTIAVEAKRYISGLWRDTKKEPYTKLFNGGTAISDLWYVVQVTRLIDSEIDKFLLTVAGRDRLICVHGNRFALFCIFEAFKKNGAFAKKDISKDAIIIPTLVSEVLKSLIASVNLHYKEAYPGNIFKNQDRQADLLKAVMPIAEANV